MQVHVTERGERPSVMTKARLNAPAAAQVISTLLGEMDWAQDAQILTDWTGQTGGPGGRDAGTPIMNIVVRGTPDTVNYCFVRSQIDIDDTFGKDTLDRDDLITILGGLKEAMQREFSRFQKGEVQHGRAYHHSDI